MIFRRQADNNVWHFCTNCREWPQGENYVEVKHVPVAGRMCDDCREKKTKGQCGAESPPSMSN